MSLLVPTRTLPTVLLPIIIILLALGSEAVAQRRGELCGIRGRCNSGLVCTLGVCADPPPSPGTEGGVCRASGNRCDAGLDCLAGLCARARGGLGQLCRDGGGCNDGLECNSFNLCGVRRGARGGACLTSGGQCDAGLVCAGAVCVDPPPSGGAGQPCRAGGGCDQGLECTPANLCAVPPPRGAAGQACRAGNACDAGLRCRNNLCLNAGGLAQPCLADGRCNASGLVCLSVTDTCAPAGGPLMPCRADGGCDGLLSCVNRVCVPAASLGGPGQLCRPDFSCNPGLRCMFPFCVPVNLVVREPPVEKRQEDFMARRSFRGKFDYEGYRAAVEQVARMPAARLRPPQTSSGLRPGTVTRPLTGESAAPSWEFVGPRNLDVPQAQYYGPRPVAGRVFAVAYNPADPKMIFIGTDGGGLFRSDDDGENWRPLSDRVDLGGGNFTPGWPVMYVSAVAVVPGNPPTVYAGLGDFPDGKPFGGGIMKSTDGGETWTNHGTASFGAFAVSQILVDPEDPNVLVVTTGRGPTSQEGQVFRSSDAGVNWTAVVTTRAQWSGAAVGARTSNGERTYYVVGTLPPDSNNNRVAVIMRSTDRGSTWSMVTSPTGGAEGIAAVASSPAAPSTVYLLLTGRGRGAAGTIWRSTDQGNTWRNITRNFPHGQSNDNWQQGGFDYFIAATRRSGNRDVLYVGLIDIAMSPDGGTTWESIGGPTTSKDAKTHNDQHAIAFHPTDPNIFLLANDGGVYRGRFSRRANTTFFQSLNRRLPITTFYRAAFHPTDPNVMLGGTQDNATPVSTGDLQNWLNKGGGDGGTPAINQRRPNIQYATSQGDVIVENPPPPPGLPRITHVPVYRTDAGWRVQNGPIDFQPPQQYIAPFTEDDRRPFTPELTIDPNNSTIVYTGTQFLWRLNDDWLRTPLSWSRVSLQRLSSTRTINRIAVAPSDSRTIYTASLDGEVWVTFDRGASWKRLNAPSSAPPCTPTSPPGTFICPGSANALSVNPNDPNDVLVGFASVPGLPGRLFRCTGANTDAPVWTDLSGAGVNTLPGLTINAVARDLDRPSSTFFVGNDRGVYMTDDGGQNWADAGAPLGLPAVMVTDLVAVPATRFLNAATYGRGIWRIALPTDLPGVAEFTINPSTATGGSALSARIVLSRTAPPTGLEVTLNVSNPSAISLPAAAVRVPALQKEVTVTLVATSVSADADVEITATANGMGRSARVRVTRPPGP